MRILVALALAAVLTAPMARAQTPKQPKVQPGPSEPDWIAILDRMYGLRMFDDLVNPVETTLVAVPGRFRKAGPGEVTFRPEIALGLEVVIHGGYYLANEDKDAPKQEELWKYQFKNTGEDLETGKNLPPALLEGSKTTFDPGSAEFGLYIANDQFHDQVYTEPIQVQRHNPRLSKQPYKAMIYPVLDRETGKPVPHSYLIGWEYSTNDDFQDVVTRIDNVELVPIGK